MSVGSAAVDLVLSEWLCATSFVQPKMDIVELCVAPPIVAAKVDCDQSPTKQQNSLRIEMFGSGAVVIQQFLFDSSTTILKLFEDVQHHLQAMAHTFRLLYRDQELFENCGWSSLVESLQAIQGNDAARWDEAVVLVVTVQTQEVLERRE